MAWLQITFAVENTQAEQFGELLFENGALSVTMLDAADQPIYEPPLMNCSTNYRANGENNCRFLI